MNFQVKVILSTMQNITNTHSVNPKLIRVWTFLENKNRYFGIFTFVNIPALPVSDVIPCVVDSLK